MRYVKECPQKLTGVKLKKIDKYGDYWFDTDDGLWKAEPDILLNISAEDLYLTGIILRVISKNKKYKYQFKWVKDVVEEPAKQTQEPIKDNGLSRGLTAGKSIIKRIINRQVDD